MQKLASMELWFFFLDFYVWSILSMKIFFAFQVALPGTFSFWCSGAGPRGMLPNSASVSVGSAGWSRCGGSGLLDRWTGSHPRSAIGGRTQQKIMISHGVSLGGHISKLKHNITQLGRSE
jgi:hypothetical protein